MPNLDKIFGGIGILIFVFLLFNAQHVDTVLKSLADASTGIIKALQGQK